MILRQHRVDAAIGGMAGLASGLLGVGGGFLIVALQGMWSRTDQHRVGGTSLAAILPIAGIGAIVYYFGRGVPQVDAQVALFLVVGSMGGALVGAAASTRVPDRALRMMVAILLVIIALKELHDGLTSDAGSFQRSSTDHLQLASYLLLVLCGVVIGILSGLTGVGGGIFMVPVMVLGFGISQRIAQGTSLVAILPTAAVGALAQHRYGNVDLRSAGWMAITGTPSALIGASLAQWLPQRALVLLFGVFLLAAATRVWPRLKASSVTPEELSRSGG